MRKRIISTLLCLVLLVGLLPAQHVHASDEYEDGDYCLFCGQYIWGDWICDCGDGSIHCGENSDHYDCYEENHCFECGKALEFSDMKCEECGTGYDCCLSGFREYCENCGVCFLCLPFDSICDVCGWCIECTGTSKLCELCGECYECGGGMCSEGEDHPCWRCHETYVCSDCGQCLLNPDSDEDTVEWCSECHRCEDCVEKCSAWGEGHYYCLEEHDDFDYCPDCGHCYLVDIMNEVSEKTYGCEDCNKCANCVSAVCKDCGRCFDCTEICERCGEYCLDCHDSHGTVCERCGMCFKGVGGHKACGICWECLESCPECGMCMECEDEIHCPGCGACSGAKGAFGSTVDLCEDCGFCENCAPLCDICDKCVECEPDTHCSSCYKHEDTYLCPGCGICEDCAESDSGWCDDCHYCFDCADEDTHCSECHEEKSICDACGMCDECAKSENQHCGESDCTNCYENYIYCPTCDKCIECIGEDNYCYDCFQCKAHHATNPGGKRDGNGTHTHKWGDWKATAANHWQECLLCKEKRYSNVHTYKKDQHTCTVCGYNTEEPFVITQQPKDARAKVSDPDAEPGDSLHVSSNKVTFRVSVTAFQKGTLSYQWYRVEGTGSPILLTDDGDTTGSTTAKLTTYVPTDACSTTMRYRCEVTLTGSDGTVLKEEDSEDAYLNASHVYDNCDPVSSGSTTPEYTLYYKPGNHVVHIDVYPETGKHQYTCHGEGGCGLADPKRSAEPHTYGDPVIFQASDTSNDPAAFVPWYRYTCTECGYKHYVKKHVHQFEVPTPTDAEDTDTMAFLELNCTDETHPMRCTVEGCSAMSHEKHEFTRTSYGDPGKNENGRWTYGSYVLECRQCGYVLGGKALLEANSGRNWGGAFTLVVAKDAAVEVYDSNVLKANSLARPDDTVLLIPRQRNDDQKITGWTAKYEYYTYSGSDKTTTTVDPYSLEVSRKEDGNWYFTMPDFAEAGYENGGYLYLTPTYESCDHSCGTMLVNYKAAVCMNEGYTGDTVCKNCGKILDVNGVGEVISAGTGHTGTWELIKGTAVTATCRHRGYTGDYKCSACGEIKAGTKTGYKHGATVLKDAVTATCSTHGYTGDVYCLACDKKLISGRALPKNANNHTGRTVTVGAYEATCLNEGSTGEKKCTDCGATLQEASKIPALGHEWDAGTVTLEPTTTDPGVMTYHCTNTWHVTLRRTGVTTGRGSTVTRTCNGTRTEAIPALGTPTIDSVALEVNAPAVGRSASAVMTTATTYSVANTSWLDEYGNDVSLGSAFAMGKTYVVKVELEATGDYAFTSATTFTLNGANATVVTLGLDSVTLTYTFPPVDSVDITPSKPAHKVDVKDALNGSASANHDEAREGTIITVTVDPAKGYTLETLTVLDKNGKEVKLTDKGNGKYTFTMPDSKVTVKATFMEDNSMLNFFVDVPADKYYYDAVLWAAENGIAGGVDAVHFAPNATCTRAQAVTFLWRAAGKPEVKSTVNPFSDVNENSTFYKAILWAVENGITKGTTETTFSPNAKCTRAQIMTFLWRSQKSPVISEANPFTDVKADAYYIDAVLWAAANAITGGTTATTFSPNANCTRAQIITFIYRCMK